MAPSQALHLNERGSENEAHCGIRRSAAIGIGAGCDTALGGGLPCGSRRVGDDPGRRRRDPRLISTVRWDASTDRHCVTNCKAEETSISWNIKGAPVRPDRKEIPGRRVCPVRKGPAGPQGAVGPSGALSTFDAIQGLPCTVGGVAGTISLTYGTTNQATLKCLALAEPPPPVDPNQATVLLSEVAPNQPSGQDLIELRVASGGTLEGLVLVRGATVQTVIATLPAMTVQAGDVIVVHLNPAIEVMTELLSKSECFAPACYSTAWDVRAVIGTISSIDGSRQSLASSTRR